MKIDYNEVDKIKTESEITAIELACYGLSRENAQEVLRLHINYMTIAQTKKVYNFINQYCKG
jgi:hypothetical protein